MTATCTVPAGAVGINPVMVVESTTRGSVDGAASGSSCCPPTVTAAGATAFVDAPLVFAKPVPVIVTSVPPGPEDGVIEVMVGWGAAVKTNPSSRVAVSVLGLFSGSGLTTVTSTVP